MHCATCGAEIQKPDQRYCHECGATVPRQAGPGQSIVPVAKLHGPSRQAIVDRGTGRYAPAPHELLAGVMPNTLQNRLIVGGVTVVVAILAIWMLVNWIVDTMIHVVLPIGVLLAVIYVGFRYLQSRRAA